MFLPIKNIFPISGSKLPISENKFLLPVRTSFRTNRNIFPTGGNIFLPVKTIFRNKRNILPTSGNAFVFLNFILSDIIIFRLVERLIISVSKTVVYPPAETQFITRNLTRMN